MNRIETAYPILESCKNMSSKNERTIVESVRAHAVFQPWCRLHSTIGVALCLLALATCSALAEPSLTNADEPDQQFSGNPILAGWYADPEATIIADKYWIYPTYSDRYEKQLFFDCFSSPDLANWQKHERILDSQRIRWARRAMWAPSIIGKDGRYFLFFGANDIQTDNESGGIGVAVSDSPSGPFEDYLEKPLIDKFVNGAQPIDQMVFRDDDGTDYLIYGGWSHCNIAKLKPDYTGFLPFEDGETFKEITPEGYVEGPAMFRRKGKYYFMWSEGGWGGPNYSVAYAIAESPLGPFSRIGKILRQDPNVATGAGHNSVIYDQVNNLWYAVYHRRPLGETDRDHRVVCIDRMEFDADGRIKPIKITFKGVAAQRLHDPTLNLDVNKGKPQ